MSAATAGRQLRADRVDWVRAKLDEWTDTNGDLDLIGIVQATEKHFGLPPREAEALVEEACS